jgi:hypothetical protein
MKFKVNYVCSIKNEQSNPQKKNDNQHPENPQILDILIQTKKVMKFKVNYVCSIKNE